MAIVHKETTPQPLPEPISDQDLLVNAYIGQFWAYFFTKHDEGFQSIYKGIRHILLGEFKDSFSINEGDDRGESGMKVGVKRLANQEQFAALMLKYSPEIITEPGVQLDEHFVGATTVTVIGETVHGTLQRQMVMEVIGDGTSPLRVTTVEFIP